MVQGLIEGFGLSVKVEDGDIIQLINPKNAGTLSIEMQILNILLIYVYVIVFKIHLPQRWYLLTECKTKTYILLMRIQN